MITVYYSGTSNSSNRKTLEWFKLRNIGICKKKITEISKNDLLHILSISDYGFSTILKNKLISKNYLAKEIEKLQLMSFSESIEFILKTPDVLKTPIIFEKDKLLVGFNEDEIRKFIPKNRRKI